jgi:hypothetical protein
MPRFRMLLPTQNRADETDFELLVAGTVIDRRALEMTMINGRA